MSHLDEIQVIEERIIQPNGEVQFKLHKKGRLLGKGGFASVYELLPSDTKQAIKIINKSSLTKGRVRQKLMSEVRIHSSLSHSNIVKFDHFFENDEFFYIILELCSNETLNDLLRRRKRLTELEVQCYSSQLLQTLKYLHSHKVIHRDIKLSNIFLSDKMELKLGDFGLAAKVEFKGERKRTICGTPNYIAPEILTGQFGHSYEVDIWSFGVVVYLLLIGKPPFESSDVQTTYKRIRNNIYSFPENPPLSSEAKDLIEKILVTDPFARLGIVDIEQHDFFKKNVIPALMPTSTLAIPPSIKYLNKFLLAAALVKPRELSCKTPRAASHPPDRSSQGAPRTSSAERGVQEKNSIKTATCSAYIPITGGPVIWIKKWLDYSNKYGIGYKLSNGSAGVYFNDNTRMVLNKDTTAFQYFWKGENDDQLAEYSLKDYPSVLKKKVTLLIHFNKHLEIDSKAENWENPLTHVKKWITTSHAIIFRLTNKLVQVFFTDKSELLVCTKDKIVTLLNKKGKSFTCPLQTAMDSSSKELTKRLKYTKQVLITCFTSPNNN